MRPRCSITEPASSATLERINETGARSWPYFDLPQTVRLDFPSICVRFTVRVGWSARCFDTTSETSIPWDLQLTTNRSLPLRSRGTPSRTAESDNRAPRPASTSNNLVLLSRYKEGERPAKVGIDARLRSLGVGVREEHLEDGRVRPELESLVMATLVIVGCVALYRVRGRRLLTARRPVGSSESTDLHRLGRVVCRRSALAFACASGSSAPSTSSMPPSWGL